MFNPFRKQAKKLENPSIKTIKDIQNLTKTMESSALGKLIRQYAEEGNLVCLEFLSTHFMLNMSNPNIPEKQLEEAKKYYVYYAEIAAKLGDPLAKKNLGLFYIKQINMSDKNYYEDYTSEDIENLKKSIYWKRSFIECGNGNDKLLEDVQNLEVFLNGILKART